MANFKESVSSSPVISDQSNTEMLAEMNNYSESDPERSNHDEDDDVVDELYAGTGAGEFTACENDDGNVETDESDADSNMARILIRQRNRMRGKNVTDSNTTGKNSNGLGLGDGGDGGDSDRDCGDDDACNGTRGAVDHQRPKSNSRKGPPFGFVPFVCLALISCIPIVGFLWYKDVQAKRVTTRLDALRVIDSEASSAKNSPDRFWGTYRPGVYFGMKTRCPHSPVTGLMWFTQFTRARQLQIRHTCEQGDQLPRYGWLQHDGANFGVQEIVDKNVTLTTEFVKRPGGHHGGDWTARISGKARTKSASNSVVSLIFYTSLDESDTTGHLQSITKGNQLIEVRGYNNDLGSFTIKFPPVATAQKYHFVSTYSPGIQHTKNVILQSLKRVPYAGNKMMAGLAGNILAKEKLVDYQPNIVAHQLTTTLPFEMEVVFESESHQQRTVPLSGTVFTQLLKHHQESFNDTFEDKFKLIKKGYGPKEIAFAKAALSNMLGGVGYFYGQSIVRSPHTSDPVLYWNAALMTAVPSRSFFPRGFLWDEGFHNLLISKWDTALSKEIIGHWLDLMNVEGWIPREQILGGEARSKVPEAFVVQNNANANPPTLFLPLQSILRDATPSENGDFVNYLQHVFPRLVAWYQWFNTTQSGPRPSTYRWRGRDGNTDSELNPKTLTSGLDDYPRASHPTDGEFHVDLRCWMAFASGVMVDIARAIKAPYADYEATYRRLSDNKLLDQLHWSPRGGMYSDFGSHTTAVVLQRPTAPPPPKPKPGQRKPPPQPKPPMVRVVKGQDGPTERFVDSFGYISLFPFLLQILEPKSPKLGQILTDLKNPDRLWTKFGLRSLSKADPLYMKYNTEHDPPYWRGAIWINMNYLAVRSLHYYSKTAGPHQDNAEELYNKLRQNLVSNVIKEYQRSGYIWENYNDSNGKGQGSHPFTGWSALVTLIMAEEY